MSEERAHDYFDRKSSTWSIQGFMRECDLQPFDFKLDFYLKTLENIANREQGDRQNNARALLKRYKEASKNLFAGGFSGVTAAY
ncbi:hypothetical protein BC936DRAFT_139852 [Jimgerdemannia flammicorona]|uniref:Uncharacterized protein n=1 Tax=Jimgerdemannia flammicorona TaxID=994334 RepID=A0A433DHJ5_9FUNG|nr:hypothetical protein BC936DRAFT_139852 [Jimgerdemannia flammicorona]